MTENWPAAGADDWMDLVRQSLRGRDLAELSSTTRDGIEIWPLYTDGPERPAPLAAADPRRLEAGWDVRQRHGPGAATADALDRLSAEIEQDLAGGVTSLELEVPAGVDADGLDALLDGVDLAATPLALAPHAELDAAAAVIALAVRRGTGLASGSSLGVDPLGDWARSGRRMDCVPAAAWTASVVAGPEGWGSEGSGSGPLGPAGGSGLAAGVRALTVDGVRYADAGATEAQALGWATATGVAYLRALVGAGVPVDSAAALIGFRLAATADQFVTVAALRAARVMWERVVTASGGSAEAARQYQHAVTASHMYSRRDPWVNLLRGATAALAAGVAGADAVTVLPFDHASGAVDADGALGRRLARNTQLLLLEESQLARAADPAGGSFYVESLTEQLASDAWRVLQEVEASGGIEAAIDSGALAAATEESWQARLGALRTRSEPLTGVSEFPLLDEPSPAGRGTAQAAGAAGLPIRRLAEPFEDLRDAADRHHAVTGDRPAVWVAALGSASDHSARTAWTQNLLAAGGIEARGATGVDSPVAAAADFAMSGLAAAVVTGADDMYRLRGPATASALSEAGAAFVALVCDLGTPAELLEDLRSAGVDEIWHDGIDIISALERLHGALGVA
ncbi:MAG: methylmalonyl-CoA mutase family protein [Acidimicrobiaceae bacterium]|nr:methylmalonyl-CoA mutase family protein [Acidimicrobiaceae bacterium]